MIEITPTQKKFKKQMKAFEEQGKIPDSYKARRKRITFVPKRDITSMIVMLFVAYTWIAPLIHRLPNYRSQVTQNNYPSIRQISPTGKSGAGNYKSSTISNYLQECAKADIKTNDIIAKLTNRYGNSAEYLSQTILADLIELTEIITKMQTYDSTFENLQSIYNERLSIYEEILMNINDSNFDTRYLVARSDELSSEIRSEMIMLLEDNNMRYEILEDGTLLYYYYY